MLKSNPTYHLDQHIHSATLSTIGLLLPRSSAVVAWQEPSHRRPRILRNVPGPERNIVDIPLFTSQDFQNNSRRYVMTQPKILHTTANSNNFGSTIRSRSATIFDWRRVFAFMKHSNIAIVERYRVNPYQHISCKERFRGCLVREYESAWERRGTATPSAVRLWVGHVVKMFGHAMNDEYPSVGYME